ncbi:MAG: CotH kinase family protein [Lachnospiraceae bacterium]|nr:CotH kinase family protein [Lachnospiraceae bacterium]
MIFSKKRNFITAIIVVFVSITAVLTALYIIRDGNESNIVINEVCSSNFSVLNDGYGKYPDWIELYNAGDTAVSLKGFFLKSSKGKRFDLPNTVLEPGSYILFAKNVESEARGEILNYDPDASIGLADFLLNGAQTNRINDRFFDFSISSSGDELFLFEPGGRITDKVDIPSMPYDTSYARVTDGGGEWHKCGSTPGYSNDGSEEVVDRVLQAPSLSAESGFYDGEFDLTITAGNGETVYYTTDCTDPLKKGKEYTGPVRIYDRSEEENNYASRQDVSPYIVEEDNDYRLVSTDPVDKAMVIKAVAVNKKGEVSYMAEGTYFVGFQDKEVYDGVSIIALNPDADAMFDPVKGRYVLGEKYDEYMNGDYVSKHWEKHQGNYSLSGRESEEEGSVLYFNEEHELQIDQKAGIRIRGGHSRTFLQKGFNLYARSVYGGNDHFDHNIFDYRLPERQYSLFAGGQDDRYKVKDVLFSRLMEGENVAVNSFKPCFLFLDGEFFGLYWLSDKYDDVYFHEKYEVYEGNSEYFKVDYTNIDEVHSSEKYKQSFGFAGKEYIDDKAYEEICGSIDMDSLITYYAANFYIEHCNDWPTLNKGIWRSRSADLGEFQDMRWRYLIFDVNSSSLSKVENIQMDFMLNEDAVLSSLMTNESFRKAFYEKYKYLRENVFNADRAKAIIEEIDGEIGQLLYMNWDHYYSKDYANEEKYKKYIDDLKVFFEKRADYLDPYMEEIFLK